MFITTSPNMPKNKDLKIIQAFKKDRIELRKLALHQPEPLTNPEMVELLIQSYKKHEQA